MNTTTTRGDILAALGPAPNLDHIEVLGGKFGLSYVLMKLGVATPKGATRDVIRGGVQVCASRQQLADWEADVDEEIERTLGQYSLNAQDALTLGLAQAPRPLAEIVD